VLAMRPLFPATVFAVAREQLTIAQRSAHDTEPFAHQRPDRLVAQL